MRDTLKVTADHVRRAAFVYVRQSTTAQVEHHRESTDRQYKLVDHAMDLGWARDQITIIDNDLGVSGAGLTDRSGFAHMTTQVALGRVGLVLGLEVSRLARNNADWYRLLDLCGVTDTLIGDADGIYHPGLFNDRLVLGLNRPDSYSTSYSTSRRSKNRLEIRPWATAACWPNSCQMVATADTPMCGNLTDDRRRYASSRQIAISISESSREPPWTSAACCPSLARDRRGGRCTPHAVT
jgi:hypothetical protein